MTTLNICGFEKKYYVKEAKHYFYFVLSSNFAALTLISYLINWQHPPFKIQKANSVNCKLIVYTLTQKK